MLSSIWIAFTKYRIALVCATIYFLHMGMMRITSLLVVASVDRYNVSREQATFPYVLRGIVENLSGPFVGYLGCKIGLGRMTILGCGLFSIAVAVCFFAESIIFMTICWGIFLGLSMGMADHLLPTFLSSHYEKDLAKANGISFAGSSLGAFIYTLFYAHLLKTYGTSGSFLILSAFSLNTVGAAMLLAFSQQRLDASQKRNCTSNKDHSLNTENTCSDVSDGLHDKTCNLKENNCCAYGDGKGDSERINCASLSNSFKNISYTSGEEKITVNESSKDCRCKSIDTTKCNNITNDENGEFGSNHNKTTSHTNAKQLCLKEEDPSESSAKPRRNLIWQTLTLFCDPLFVVIVLTQSCFMVILHFLFITIIDFALDKDVPMNLSVYILMSSSIFDLIGRLSLGTVPDSGYISDTRFSALCYLITGICSAGIAVSTEFYGMLVCFCVIAFLIGGQLLIAPVIVSNYFDGEEKILAMTSRYILVAPLSFTVSPLIGFFREGLGSYKWLYYSICVFCVFASILILSIPSIANMKRRRRNREIID